MRILFLTLASFSKFPTYKRAVGMGESLASAGHSVAIAVLDCPENRERMMHEAPHCQALWFRGNICSELWSKVRMIWKWRPQVVYSTSYSIRNLALLRWMLPIRIKYVVEFSELYSHYNWESSWRRWRWAIWESLALVECGYVLAASTYLREHFSSRTKCWPFRCRCFYSPYAYPPYLKPARQPIGGSRHIIFMALMSRGYGAFNVLEAFEALVHKRLDVELDMIGGGPDKAEIIEWVREHRLEAKVHVHGFVPESRLNDYFSLGATFVSPLRDCVEDRARCPSKLFYYLPYNKPIVTCKIGNPAEVLGVLGFYYSPLDVGSMSEALVRALDAESTFSYPAGFVESHSWAARAKSFEDWITHE